ncbi:MAG TPA: PIN domain-containing protein [Candidatus Paceibacterota bacterium]|nr:PIN domain-containing protein [Candidatus Paceibacterota bacterium]
MEERNKVFADSNYFVALFNTDDSLYEEARHIAQKISSDATQLAISNFIFLEVVSILSQRKGKAAAIQAGQDILSHPSLINVVHVDETLQQAAWDIFQSIEHKNISFVDCSIIAAIKTEGIKKLLTFDKTDFKKLQKKYRFSFYE